ncbi:MAG: ABC transporter ATP-binding protein [Paracoccaceae bacterium]|nr:ABC transporter ATP-binding protein [Paracoccaceae bacterium]
MTALRSIDVSKVFEDGFTALADINLSVDPGEFVTLLGPSGCGKTTLLKIFAGFYAPTTGRVEQNGADVTSAPPEKRDTAMCFQSYALFPHLTVAENIEFGPKQNRVDRDERLDRLNELLRQVDLERHREKLPNKLSGGQQQRVALARALAMRPSVVLFDEPLSNLDAKLREQVRREIRGLQRKFGFTAIYVTHDQSEALAMSDRVVVMSGGKVEQIGAPEEVYQRPETAFVADFIGSANLLPFDRVDDHVVETPLGRLTVSNRPDPNARFICWRPEDAEFGVSEGGNIVTSDISERAYQGAYTDLHISVAGAPDQRLHWPGGASCVGQSATFRLPPERIRFVRGEIA